MFCLFLPHFLTPRREFRRFLLCFCLLCAILYLVKICILGGACREADGFRRQLHHQPRLLRCPSAHHARRVFHPRDLRLSDDARPLTRRGKARGAVRRLRPPRADVPPPRVRGLQGHAPRHARRARHADAGAQGRARRDEHPPLRARGL